MMDRLEAPRDNIVHVGSKMQDAGRMSQARNYAASELLRDGRRVTIRALKPEDEAALTDAVEGLSAASLHRRFFAVKRNFSDREKDFFLHVDFVNHVALIAEIADGPAAKIIGGARYIVSSPGSAEVAFAIVDEFQGQGLGTLLMRHLLTLARAGGVNMLVAEVLAENAAMLKVFAKSGLELQTRRDGGVVHVQMKLS
jgi:RimJ/RimL family protein N-acetyltransferase